MLDWIVERIQALVNAVPALLVAEDSPNFMLGRTLMGLLLIVIIVYTFAMRPFRSSIAHCFGKLTGLVMRKK
jgi:hypothetical protein